MLAIQLRGGRTLVQDPDDAPYPEMPRNVLDQLSGIDYVVRVAAMPGLIVQLVQELTPTAARVGSKPMASASGEPYRQPTNSPQAERAGARTVEMNAMNLDATPTDPLATEPDVFICPECGGALTPVHHDRMLHYRCHTGHTFGAQSLESAYGERVEHALWAAMSALKERATLNERLAQRTSIAHLRIEYARQAEEARRQAQVVQELIAGLE
jgi:two-component system chemotaxis response regulator CheB